MTNKKPSELPTLKKTFQSGEILTASAMNDIVDAVKYADTHITALELEAQKTATHLDSTVQHGTVFPKMPKPDDVIIITPSNIKNLSEARIYSANDTIGTKDNYNFEGKTAIEGLKVLDLPKTVDNARPDAPNSYSAIQIVEVGADKEIKNKLNICVEVFDLSPNSKDYPPRKTVCINDELFYLFTGNSYDNLYENCKYIPWQSAWYKVNAKSELVTIASEAELNTKQTLSNIYIIDLLSFESEERLQELSTLYTDLSPKLALDFAKTFITSLNEGIYFFNGSDWECFTDFTDKGTVRFADELPDKVEENALVVVKGIEKPIKYSDFLLNLDSNIDTSLENITATPRDIRVYLHELTTFAPLRTALEKINATSSAEDIEKSYLFQGILLGNTKDIDLLIVDNAHLIHKEETEDGTSNLPEFMLYYQTSITSGESIDLFYLPANSETIDANNSGFLPAGVEIEETGWYKRSSVDDGSTLKLLSQEEIAGFYRRIFQESFVIEYSNLFSTTKELLAFFADFMPNVISVDLDDFDWLDETAAIERLKKSKLAYGITAETAEFFSSFIKVVEDTTSIYRGESDTWIDVVASNNMVSRIPQIENTIASALDRAILSVEAFPENPREGDIVALSKPIKTKLSEAPIYNRENAPGIADEDGNFTPNFAGLIPLENVIIKKLPKKVDIDTSSSYCSAIQLLDDCGKCLHVVISYLDEYEPGNGITVTINNETEYWYGKQGWSNGHIVAETEGWYQYQKNTGYKSVTDTIYIGEILDFAYLVDSASLTAPDSLNDEIQNYSPTKALEFTEQFIDFDGIKKSLYKFNGETWETYYTANTTHSQEGATPISISGAVPIIDTIEDITTEAAFVSNESQQDLVSIGVVTYDTLVEAGVAELLFPTDTADSGWEDEEAREQEIQQVTALTQAFLAFGKDFTLRIPKNFNYKKYVEAAGTPYYYNMFMILDNSVATESGPMPSYQIMIGNNLLKDIDNNPTFACVFYCMSSEEEFIGVPAGVYDIGTGEQLEVKTAAEGELAWFSLDTETGAAVQLKAEELEAFKKDIPNGIAVDYIGMMPDEVFEYDLEYWLEDFGLTLEQADQVTFKLNNDMIYELKDFITRTNQSSFYDALGNDIIDNHKKLKDITKILSNVKAISSYINRELEDYAYEVRYLQNQLNSLSDNIYSTSNSWSITSKINALNDRVNAEVSNWYQWYNRLNTIENTINNSLGPMVSSLNSQINSYQNSKLTATTLPGAITELTSDAYIDKLASAILAKLPNGNEVEY